MSYSPPTVSGQLALEFEHRRQANPQFSLRAFARALGLSPGYLSSLLGGNKRLSPTRAIDVAGRLGYGPTQTKAFLTLAQAETWGITPNLNEEHYYSAEAPEDVLFRPLALDVFGAMADWQHSALLLLIKTKGFKEDSAWIAKRLGITAQAATLALDRLLRLGLIKRARGKKLVCTNVAHATPSDEPYPALRHFHGQMLEKARVALEKQSVHQRDITGVTLAIRKEDIPRIKAEIRSFRRRLAQIMNKPGQAPDAVYQCAIQFFEITTPIKTSEES